MSMMVDIPVASGYKHSIILNSSVSSPNVDSAHITGAYMEADHCSICVGLADGPLAPCYELLDHGAITSTYT